MSRRRRRSRRTLAPQDGEQSVSSARYEADPTKSVRYNYRVKGPRFPVRVIREEVDRIVEVDDE